jgi:Tol biopolymer transport system component
MEYVDGDALRVPLPLDQALSVASQILDALETAHRKGIIHRDLKPDNILLSRNGVKVLDFGLAKITHAQTSVGDTQTAMETLPLTAEGTILGTLPYMSPEQIEGHEADARSDIFSFGVVLYELITGRQPFTGKSQASLIASILKTTPQPLHELKPLTPPGIDSVVQTCLQRDPEKRWQSAREVKHALKWIPAETSPAREAAKLHLWQGLAALMALIALGMAGWIIWPKAPGHISRFEALLPENVTPTDSVSISPDGRKLVLTAEGQSGLWIRSFDTLQWRPLPGTEGASTPFWSPDSRYVAFAVTNQIKKVDTTGGPPETLCTVSTDVRGSSGTWNRDGVIVFGSWGGGAGGPLWKVSEAGGTASALTQVDTAHGEFYHTWPTFLPDGKHFLYFRSGPLEVEGIYAGSLDAKPDEQSRERILASPVTAIYANGYLFFQRQSTLLAQGFNVRRLKLQDAPIPVAEAVRTTWYATGIFSVSPGGVLAYRAQAQVESSQLTWINRQGKTLSTFGPPGTDSSISLSPDGRRGVVRDGVPGDLWTLDFSSSDRRTRLTFRKNIYSPGVWSPDGERIAYSAGNLGDTLYEKASSGVGEEKELLKEPGLRHYPTSWSADGRFLLYHTENAPKTGYDLWVLPLQGDHKPVLLLGETYNEWAGVFSPDIHWVAYASLEAGGNHAEVYVRPFQVSERTGMPALGESKWQVTKGGGNWPIWRNPNEIIFNSAPFGPSISATPVKTTATVFESGVPQRLFALPNLGVDLAPDDQRFLLAAPQVVRSAPASITMVLNWPALMNK